MTGSDKDRNKALLRLLKLLQRQPGKGAEIHKDHHMSTLICAGRSYRFEFAVIDRARGEGLINVGSDKIALTGPGLARLKRALHPEEPFRAQQAALKVSSVKMDGEARPVVKNTNESPLLRLFTRKQAGGRPWLDEAQFAAGERLRADFERAGLQPRVSANWEASVAASRRGGGGSEISDFALDARKRLERALHVLGPELEGVALDICCFLKGLEQVESERRWPPRSAKLILRAALSLLARHYGLAGQPCSASGHQTRLRQWGTPDYRPGLYGAGG